MYVRPRTGPGLHPPPPHTGSPVQDDEKQHTLENNIYRGGGEEGGGLYSSPIQILTEKWGCQMEYNHVNIWRKEVEINKKYKKKGKNLLNKR